MSEDAPASRLRRAMRASGALAGIGALAGCGGSADDADTGSDAADADTGNDAADADSQTGTGAATSTAVPTDTPGAPSSPVDTSVPASSSGTTTTPTTPCETPTAEPGSERARVEAELERVERELRVARFRRTFLRAGRSLQPDGFEQSTLDAAATVGEQVAASVVKLPQTVPNDGPFFTPGGATGWFRRPHEVVTNAHVADRLPETFTGELRDGTRIDLERVAVSSGPYNEPMDLALLRTEYAGTPLSVGDATGLQSGQPLVMVGHPVHFGEWVTSLGRYVYSGADLADAGIDDAAANDRGLPSPLPSGFSAVLPAQGGNSGSPVVTLDGDVVGTIWFGWQSVPGSMQQADADAEPFVYDQPIAPRAHSSNHHTIGAIDDWLAEHR